MVSPIIILRLLNLLIANRVNKDLLIGLLMPTGFPVKKVNSKKNKSSMVKNGNSLVVILIAKV